MTHKYQFGAFLLDANERQLSLDGNAVHLQPKDFDVLHYLLQHAGQLASKQDIMDAVWGEVVVTENSLNRCIGKIRTALHDEASTPAYIETIPTHGYRMICEVWKMSTAGQFEGQAAITKTTAAKDSISFAASLLSNTSRNLILFTLASVVMVVGVLADYGFLFNDQQAVSQPIAISTSSQNFPVMRFTVPVSEDADLYLGGIADTGFGRPTGPSLALSNDGNLVVYGAWQEGPDGQRSSQLYLRRLDQVATFPIQGTEGASAPFFSPDGAWIGFFVGRSMKRVSVTGGVIETIVSEVQSDGRYGVNWGDDGRIVYAGRSPVGIGVYRVASSGGSAELIATLSSAPSPANPFIGYIQPQLLPGSKVLLFATMAQSQDPERAEIIAMNLDSGTQISLLTNAMNPYYVAETGHLLFMRQGALMAVGFDPDQLVTQGEPVVVEEDVMQAVGTPSFFTETGAAQLAVSSSGHMVYVRGGVFPHQQSTLTRVTLEGEAEPFNSVSPANINYINMRLSPSGEKLAFAERQGRSTSLYVYDLALDNTQQLTTGAFQSAQPSWSPDGKSIAFSGDLEDNTRNIYRMAVDGSDEQPERLAPSDKYQQMMSWSSEGVIAYTQDDDAAVRDIWILPPDGEPAPFFTSDAQENYATFSPDGKWLAYSATNSRGEEVYIRPYPGPGTAVLISGNGSRSPAWSRDGTQLYFRRANSTLERRIMMVVDIAEGRPSPARVLIDPWPYYATGPSRSYDVLEDGALIAAAPDEVSSNNRERYRVDELTVVLNFLEVLRQRVAD